MCRESPFPRCESHAKEKMEIKHAKMQTASNEYAVIKAEELDKQHFLERDHNSVDTNPRVVKALAKYAKAQKEYDEAVEENNITLSSLKNLKEQIIDIKTHLRNPSLKPTVDSYDYTEEGVQKLESLHRERLNKRKARIRAYDNTHHTVNGRQPSKHGTAAGVIALKTKQAKAFDNWMTALEQNKPDKEIAKRAKEVQNIQKAYGHAVATVLQKRQGMFSYNPTSQTKISSKSSNQSPKENK
jgi:hypothetical protein